MKSVSGQLDHLTRLFQEAARPLLEGAGYDSVQTAISTSSRMTELKGGIAQSLIDFLNLNPFADEKEDPNPAYSYTAANLPSVDMQIARQLAGIPGLSDIQTVKVTYRDPSSVGTDGLMAIPFLTDLGNLLGIGDPLDTGYGALGEKVLEGIAATRSFCNYREGKLNSDYIRLHTDVREKLAALESKVSPEEGKLNAVRNSQITSRVGEVL